MTEKRTPVDEFRSAAIGVLEREAFAIDAKIERWRSLDTKAFEALAMLEGEESGLRRAMTILQFRVDDPKPVPADPASATEWMVRPIGDLGLDTPSEQVCFNAIGHAKYVADPKHHYNASTYTVGDLITLTQHELRITRNCGPKKIAKIEAALAAVGLALAPEKKATLDARELAKAAPDMFALLRQMHASFTSDSETCRDCGVDNMAVVDGEAEHEESCWVMQIESILEAAKPGWKKNKGVAHDEVNTERGTHPATTEEHSPQVTPSSSASSDEARR